jgi:hypothetical protein
MSSSTSLTLPDPCRPCSLARALLFIHPCYFFLFSLSLSLSLLTFFHLATRLLVRPRSRLFDSRYPPCPPSVPRPCPARCSLTAASFLQVSSDQRRRWPTTTTPTTKSQDSQGPTPTNFSPRLRPPAPVAIQDPPRRNRRRAYPRRSPLAPRRDEHAPRHGCHLYCGRWTGG